MSAGDVTTLSPPRKRPTPDDGIEDVSTPNKVQKTYHDDAGRTVTTPAPNSPALSVLSEARPSLAPSTNVTPSKADSKHPMKKRTKAEIDAAKIQKAVEKAQKEVERQAKLVEKEEKRKQKEDEDRIKEEERKKKQAEKDEEKLKKQAERDAKQLQRDQEKAAKEADKQKKVDEQQKKERAQLRMSAFFIPKPATASSNRTTISQAPATSSGVVASHTSKDTLTDYAATFLPFSLATNAKLAPLNFFIKHTDAALTVISPQDIRTETDDEVTLPSFEPRPTVKEGQTIEELLEIIQGTSQNPIDLTSQEYGRTMQHALAELNQNLTYLEFHEDVRPPFCGSFTKSVSMAELHKVKRNPTRRQVQILNYDYDSEAEWEEPEEGEETIDDDEDDESDEGDDDMAEFIDDEANSDPLAARRPAYVRDMPPVVSGLQWQDDKGKLVPADADSSQVVWQDLEMCFLLVPQPSCIDPYSSQYWEVSKQAIIPHGTIITPNQSSTHRPALTDKTRKMNGVNSLAPKVFKVTKTIPVEEMNAFKAAITGQDLTKVAMREHLKKLFPKFNKEAINNTLDDVAERESKKADAKWRLKA